VGVTRTEDGAGVFVDAKKARPDVITAIKASMAIPGLYGGSVTLDDEAVMDGGITLPCPTKDNKIFFHSSFYFLSFI